MDIDHCPPLRTPRAEDLARLVVSLSESLHVPGSEDVALRISEDLRYMHDNKLCVYCGFPLDKSGTFPKEWP